MTTIVGYRNLSAEEVSLINKIKETGKQLEVLVTEVKEFPTIDRRWMAIGQTDLQTGLMALVRSIAKPDSF